MDLTTSIVLVVIRTEWKAIDAVCADPRSRTHKNPIDPAWKSRDAGGFGRFTIPTRCQILFRVVGRACVRSNSNSSFHVVSEAMEVRCGTDAATVFRLCVNGNGFARFGMQSILETS